MKVYAVITTTPGSNYKPTVGWLTGLKEAKDWIKQHYTKDTPLAILEFEYPNRITCQDWVALLNADTLTAADELEHRVPFEYGEFRKISFENAAMKRHMKEEKK